MIELGDNPAVGFAGRLSSHGIVDIDANGNAPASSRSRMHAPPCLPCLSACMRGYRGQGLQVTVLGHEAKGRV